LTYIHHRRKGRITSAPARVVALLAVCAAAYAQAPTAPSAQSESGAAGAAPANAGAESGIQEVVVTATRREQSASKVPISITALTQDSMDVRGIKDILDVARFTPGVYIDNSGTNNISIRGIASSGGAGTTGIYLDDTPIQMRALAFNPDEALPETFDIDRVEVLRGPQGTLFGAGSEGGTVRYITTQPSVTTDSVYARAETSYTEGGEPSYEAGVAAGGPMVDNTFGVRASVWYRYDGGYIDRIDPVTLAVVDPNANHIETMLARVAALWKINDDWSVTPSIYYQNRERHDIDTYWPVFSNPSSNQYVSADPTPRQTPDKFYVPALKVEGDLGTMRLISSTSYYNRAEITGYDGTLYNLGFYQAQGAAPVIPLADFLPGTFPLLDGTGVHLPPGATNYTAPASINNDQDNLVQEIRLQSGDPNARLVWTTGVFFSTDRQYYFEQIHDPLLNELVMAATGLPYTDFFVDPNGNPVTYVPGYPYDSYFLHTNAKDQQYALYGEAVYGLTDTLKLTLGARYSWTKFSFNTLTGGPQLFLAPQANSGDQKANAFTPRVSLGWQMDPNNLLYATYAQGFRPGGANNPVPQAACATDFANFGITAAPATYNKDTVDSYEIGAKDNLNGVVQLATSIYYIRWNNIQQTVVPPICEISFIDNLGQAVAKGADFQADIAVLHGLTLELTAGYTEARYTQASRLTPAEAQPIVAAGDAIVGQSDQPAPPITFSVGAEYRFHLWDHELFARLDDEYESSPRWTWAGQDPQTLQYDPANFTLSSTNFVSMRTGVLLGGWDVSAFVDNLTDAHPLTNYDWSIDSSVPDTSRLLRAFTFRPRTIGVTAVFRY